MLALIAQVAKSFLDGLAPGGCYRTYVDHAQIAACIGNTVLAPPLLIADAQLFVHGGVSAAAVGRVPGPVLATSGSLQMDSYYPSAQVLVCV